MLSREEYVEQSYLFRSLAERLPENVPIQELLLQVRNEVLATTRLPLAIDFMLAEIKHLGTMSSAMSRLGHYFTPFQTYVVTEAENDRGRFDMRTAVEVLRQEAAYRAAEPTAQGIFLYQFECLSRNRLRYDPGLEAISRDPIFDEEWREWILIVRRQIGFVDFADMLYVRSTYYLTHHTRLDDEPKTPEKPTLFGEREGKIAWANRRKDPLYLFAALQRQLGYPVVPRPKKIDESVNLVPLLLQRVDRLEARLKLLEEEGKSGAVDITKFYGPSSPLPRIELPDEPAR
jgi:hypothetical protein